MAVSNWLDRPDSVAYHERELCRLQHVDDTDVWRILLAFIEDIFDQNPDTEDIS